MSPKDRMSNSISLMQQNLKAATSSLSKTKESITELSTLVKTQKGIAQKELTKVIKRKETHVKELESHLKEGN